MKLIFTFFAVLFFGVSAYGGDWEVVSVTPDCRAGLFCTREEIPNQVLRAGISARLAEIAERVYRANGRLSFAFMSFSEETLFQALCDFTRKGLRFEGFFDSKAGPPSGVGHRLQTQCQGPQKNNVKIHYMGMPKHGKTGWRLHHNKFVLADYGGGEHELVFGSANLSNNGLSVNFENWNFVRGKRSWAFIKDHECDLRAMRAARRAGVAEDDPRVFRKRLESCLSESRISESSLNRKLERDGVWALFAPDEQDRIFSLLGEQIRKVVPGGRIQMATYFFMHKPLLDELRSARERGVSVELLIDDDLYNGGGSIRAQKKFWDAYLKPSQTGFVTRSVDTNEEIFQMQHHKFIILEGVGGQGRTRVFGGAGQFTLSAFRNNYENFYFIEKPEVVREYQRIFSEVWGLATPVNDQEPTPKPL